MGESRFLITYPELRVVALANELDVVPVDIGFEVRCAETAKISITLDGENKMLMRVIVNGGEDKDLFNMDSEAHNCISQLVKVVRKFNVLLGRIDWCYIEYMLKEKLQKEYSELNKEVKKKAREDKLQYIEGLANEAEGACKHAELSTVYKIIKQLCESNNNDTQVLSKNGEVRKSKSQKLERCAEHFREVLNREPPNKPAQFDNTEEKTDIDISEEKNERSEIKKALCKLKIVNQ
ncbi:Hypothetical predicted protein [Mytilus galloprovincialis]|uniref:Uncharacterized protein n=1 Tax=Mytilus galloprovincialis TaxID=29158 RepID=A0A8B6D4N7_MYTGA|nr:Hypothetical predicted protein [Mytilus galloprovincialis]